MPHPTPLAGLRILLVEDDEDVREATVALLLAEGAEITALATAAPALAAIAARRGHDLLLSDVVLGGPLTGFDLAEAACAIWPRLPAVLVTGYSGATNRRPPPGVPLLLKPFRRVALLHAIAGVLAGHGSSLASTAAA